MRRKAENKTHWDYDGMSNFDLLFAMNLHNYIKPIQPYKEFGDIKDFFHSDLSIQKITENINTFIENSYVGDVKILDDDYDEKKDLEKNREYFDNIQKAERLTEWLVEDIFAIKKEAKTKNQENKVIEIENWIKSKINEINQVFSVPVYAQIYVYLIKYDKHKLLKDFYPDLNVKESFAEFAIDKLKLNKGKNSFYLHYTKYYNEKNRLCKENISYLKKVVIALKDYPEYPAAYNKAYNDLIELINLK